MKRATILILLLTGCGGSRAELPPPAAARSWVEPIEAPPPSDGVPPRPELPPVETERLPSGLTVHVVRLPSVPVVYAGLAGRGARSDDAPIELDALLEGALGASPRRGLLDDEELDRARVDERGLRLVQRMVPDTLPAVLDEYAGYVRFGAIEAADVERARRTLLARARFQRAQRSRRRFLPPDEELLGRLYGGDARRLGRTRLDARAFEAHPPDAVRQRLRQFLAPSQTAIVVVGEVDPAEVHAAVRERLGDLPAAEAPPSPAERAAPRFPDPQTRLRIYGTEDEPSAVTRLVERGPARDHEDFAAYRVLGRLAGGMFSARLNLQLRESRGATYSVLARVVDRTDHSLLEISLVTPVADAGHAAETMVEELERLGHADRITDDEMELARRVELARIAASVETPTGLGTALVDAFLAGEEPSAIVEEYDRVAALDRRAVADVASRWLRPEKAPMVIIGDYVWLFAHSVHVPGGVAFIGD